MEEGDMFHVLDMGAQLLPLAVGTLIPMGDEEWSSGASTQWHGVYRGASMGGDGWIYYLLDAKGDPVAFSKRESCAQWIRYVVTQAAAVAPSRAFIMDGDDYPSGARYERWLGCREER
jgi:hypothetical protein